MEGDSSLAWGFQPLRWRRVRSEVLAGARAGKHCEGSIRWSCRPEKRSLVHGRWSRTDPVFSLSCCFVAVWKCVTRETISPCVPYVTERAATGRWAPLVRLLAQVICSITLQLSSSRSSWLSGVRRYMPSCEVFNYLKYNRKKQKR